MKLPPAPIRFLVLVVGGWVGIRAIMLLPDATGTDTSPTPRSEAPPIAPRAAVPPLPAPNPPQAPVVAHFRADQFRLSAVTARRTPAPVLAFFPVRSVHTPLPAFSSPQSAAPPVPTPPVQAIASPPILQIATRPITSERPPDRRFSASAWLFLRDEGGAGLAPGGTLGGSQAGIRLSYRLNNDHARPLSLSGRLYLPVDAPRGAEAAIGLDWRPIARLPLHILAERRQRLGRDGRSDFGLTFYGGVERQLLRGRVRVEAYGQAGIVGVEKRDLFADGSVRAGVRAGPVEVGAGAWVGAQPGVSRVDMGPHATFRLPVGKINIRASAEWRFRVAGDAAPGSGPALTIAADF